MKQLLFIAIILSVACTKEIQPVTENLKAPSMRSAQQVVTASLIAFEPQSFYWSKGTSSGNSLNINVGWEAIGESNLVSYDLESNLSGSYVRLATVSSSGFDALATHTYVNVIPKNSKNFYYRLVYHLVGGSTTMGIPMLVDLKQKSNHICIKPSCWP